MFYWLRSVHIFTQHSRPAKIVLVGTHSDSVSPESIEKTWADLFSLTVGNNDVVARVSVSCLSGAGFDDLERAIFCAIEAGNLGCQMVPKCFKSIELWLTDESAKKIIPKVALNDVLAQFSNLKERTVRQALFFLHEMGQCLFFENLNLVVRDPQWLAATFATLITFSHNWVRKTILFFVFFLTFFSG